jgi:uncharacterized protein
MRHMLSKIALVLSLLFAGFAHAQSPAPMPEPTAEQVALGREIVQISGVSRSFDAILPQFGEQIRQSLITRPEVKKDLDEVLTGLKSHNETLREEIMITTAKIYARTFSLAELKEIAAFFKSSAGKNYVEKQPVILDQLFAQMQTWSQKSSESVMLKVREEMKKRGHNL